MNEWARKDVLRAMHRLEYLHRREDTVSAAEKAYLAASLRVAIYGPFAGTLPDRWVAELLRVVAQLEGLPSLWMLSDGNGNGRPELEEGE